MSTREKDLYEFGPFRMDPLRRLLSRDGEVVPLTPKAFATLLALVERQGQVVGKDELIQTVWPDTFITEATLTQNVFRLRKALGEGAGDHRFIVTVPGRGYSFVAAVTRRTTATGEWPALAAAGAGLSSGERRAVEAQGSLETPADTAGSRRRKGRALAAGFVLLAAGLLVLRSSRPFSTVPRLPSAPPAVAPRLSVAVLGFRNLSGKSETAWLGTALAEMFTVELGVGEQLQTISGEAVARTRMDLDLADVGNLSAATLARIRANLGCDVVLLGSFLDLGGAAGGKIRVDLRLQNTANGETLAVATETRPAGELFELVSHLGAEMRRQLGGGEVPRELAVATRAAFPSSPEAARFYAQGIDHLRTLDALSARDELLLATAAEPGFPLAHAALAAAWSSLGYDSRAEQEAARALALSGALSRADRLLVEGLREETRGSWPRAVEIYDTLWTFFPDDLEHGLRLARAQTAAGQAKTALATLETLRRLLPPLSADPRIDLAEAAAAEALSDYRREETLAARAVARGEALGARLLTAHALQVEAAAARKLGRPAESLAAVERAGRIYASAGDRSGSASTLADRASLLTDQGDLDAARRLYLQALNIDRETGNQRGRLPALVRLGTLEALLGNLAPAKQHLQEAVAIAGETNDRSGRAGALVTLGGLQHAEGELAAATRTFAEVQATYHALGSTEGEAAAHLNLSVILNDQGKLAASRVHVETALRQLREIGHSRGTGLALSQLGQVLAEQGDLDGARGAYRELAAMSQAAGLRGLEAEASSGIAVLERLQGNLEAARKSQAQALALREESRDHYDLADSRLAMAQLALEEGDAAAAEQEARWAADQLRDLHRRDWEALARATLARALLAEGQKTAAERALRDALHLSAESENRRARLGVLTIAGRIAGENGRVDEARRTLAAVRDEARGLGLWSCRLEATFALGQVELGHGDARVGRLMLEALQREASGKGFRRLADRAAALLRQPPPSPAVTSRRRA